MSDKYDAAITFLTTNPATGEPRPIGPLTDNLSFERQISHAWANPPFHPGGCLFQFVGPNGSGCLTQVRAGRLDAATPDLTARIRADERIPTSYRQLTPDMLPIFAEWMREIDEELNR